MPNIDLIAGARPNFMKIAPIINALKRRSPDHQPSTINHQLSGNSQLSYRLIHTGQHYDKAMSGAFFEQLGIPEPDVNLGVGSGTQAEQTAGIMVRYEQVLLKSPSNLCLVVGDVTSTMACAIVARKLGVPVAHVEGGLRSGDWSMPEEINRVVTDSITNWFFTTSRNANAQLQATGVTADRIFFVGNTMIDTLLAHMDNLRPPAAWNELKLQPRGYFVLTLHRPANVDDPAKLGELLSAIEKAGEGLPVVFPVHPRTRKILATLNSDGGTKFQNSGTLNSQPSTLNRSRNPQLSTLNLIEPLPYLEFNYLVKHAKAVITDSGGITEETTVMGVPCMTLRDNTERPETVSEGTNELIGTNPQKVGPAMQKILSGQWKHGKIPELWDGHAAERIVAHLSTLLAADVGRESSPAISRQFSL